MSRVQCGGCGAVRVLNPARRTTDCPACGHSHAHYHLIDEPPREIKDPCDGAQRRIGDA